MRIFIINKKKYFIYKIKYIKSKVYDIEFELKY